jgi:hypothetical protein
MTLEVKVKTPSGPAPKPPHRRIPEPSRTTPPGTKPLGARLREPTVLDSEGLRLGMAAWRLDFAFNRRPEVAEADEEGGSSRLTTILSGSQCRASTDSLLGASSKLPHCESSFQSTGSERSTPISPPRRDRSEPAHIHAWRQDLPEPASLLKKPRPDPYLVVAHQECRRGKGLRRCPAPLGDAGLKL